MHVSFNDATYQHANVKYLKEKYKHKIVVVAGKQVR